MLKLHRGMLLRIVCHRTIRIVETRHPNIALDKQLHMVDKVVPRRFSQSLFEPYLHFDGADINQRYLIGLVERLTDCQRDQTTQ